MLPTLLLILSLLQRDQVEIRVNEDDPIYPTTVDSSLVPLGRLPLGSNESSNRGIPYDPRPGSGGGCSAGHLEGCNAYNIKVTLPEYGTECVQPPVPSLPTTTYCIVRS